jgi:hypothetical protein
MHVDFGPSKDRDGSCPGSIALVGEYALDCEAELTHRGRNPLGATFLLRLWSLPPGSLRRARGDA